MTTKRTDSILTPINVEVRLLKERAYQVLRHAKFFSVASVFGFKRYGN